ncbi:hypothetical protein LSUE1_G006533 [Lachnellula suecica]|uniref:AB hydrolase-1 domain-containing protein n=1 Tax=Lachnellula suecica TaxID=602035 RepID=A0A8T9C4B2_9HELO|nr:hypothetical protein LSUE1_G006533 [Lachnellula suecica]
MTSKPTIVLVPGAWHQPSVYSAVIASLSTHGYPALSIPLPSVGDSTQGFSDDVAAIRNCLTELVSDGKEVVLVVHSYSALPGGEAPRGLGKKEREVRGLRGGVVRYVVINGFATPEGFQPAAEGDFSMFPEWMVFDHEKGVVTVSPEDAKRIFYNDVSSEKGDELAAQLLPHSLGTYFCPPTYAAWKDIPSTFLAGDTDQSALNPVVADMMIKGAQQMVPSAFDVVEHCKEGGHCLMASYPEWTADALRRAAGETL